MNIFELFEDALHRAAEKPALIAGIGRKRQVVTFADLDRRVDCVVAALQERGLRSGDKVLLALDRDTPAAADLVGEIWATLSHRHVNPEDVTVLQPAALCCRSQSNPRTALPDPRLHT